VVRCGESSWHLEILRVPCNRRQKPQQFFGSPSRIVAHQLCCTQLSLNKELQTL